MDVIMPQLGETVAEGTVTKWYKKVGDTIKADETLFDVETDKVSTEIPAPVAGVLAEIIVAEGATAKVGTRLAVIRESGSAPRTIGKASTDAAAAPIAAAPAAGSARSTPQTAGKRVPSLERSGSEKGSRRSCAGCSPSIRSTRGDQWHRPRWSYHARGRAGSHRPCRGRGWPSGNCCGGE